MSQDIHKSVGIKITSSLPLRQHSEHIIKLNKVSKKIYLYERRY
jgi:hypothetical protein